MMRSLALSTLVVAFVWSGGPIAAQIQIQVRGGIGGRVIIQPGGVQVEEKTDEDADDLGNARIFVENRSVTSALQGVAKEIENIERLEGKPRLDRLQRAVSALQQILDLERDFAFYPTDEDRSYIRSAKAEAERLLLSMPEDGIELYRTEHGPAARAALDTAIAKSDVAGIEEVVRRYFHTDAGYEATYRLGSYHLDRAEPLAAALVFERVRERRKQVDPSLALKTAIAWGRAGMSQQAVKTLVEFRDAVPQGWIRLGGERIELFDNERDALPWLVRVLGEQPDFESLGQEQWTVFRGNTKRTGTTRPASPLWDVRWRYATIERPGDPHEARLLEIVERYGELESGHRERGLLTTPAMHPLVVGDTVVFRTFQNLRAVDLESGETVWESIIRDQGFERMLDGEDLVAQPQPNVRRINVNIAGKTNGVAVTPAQKFLAQRAWRDVTAGTLASDGRFVFGVEELDFLAGTQATPAGLIIAAPTSEGSDLNKLMATDLRTGKLAWELGGPHDDREMPLSGSFFLGPPLPLSNRLYALVERQGEIQLAVVETVANKVENETLHHPSVEWTQSLIAPGRDITYSPLRRLAGLTPSYGNGVMVCPTASGAVVAVDLARRQLAWGYRYRTTAPVVPGNPFIGRRITVQGAAGDDDENRWLDSAPTIADGLVVLTPRDSAELHCVDIVTGKKAWKRPRGDGLYVAGIHAGNVIVVERTQVQAYRLADGTRAWADPIPIAEPSGRGVQSGPRYHLPVREGIVTIDLDSGRILATSKSSTGHTPGNLVAAAGTIVSVTPRHVMALNPLSTVEQRIDDLLEGAPDDPNALTLRGELRLHRGLEEEAIADLRRAIDAGAGKPTRELYVNTLLEGLRLDFARYRDRADAALPLIEDAELKRAYLRLHARGLEQVGEHEKAFAEYVELAGLASGGQGTEQAVNGRLTVRGDRWIRPRLAELLEKSQGAQRERMEATLENELAEASAAEDVARLRRLVGAFGRLPIADRTTRAMVDRLDPEKNAAERGLLLDRLTESDDPEVAGRATAELASTALEAGRTGDAFFWFADLRGRFGDVVCLDGRTGGELVTNWLANPVVETARLDISPWPSTPMRVTPENHAGGISQTFPVDVQGPAGPFYEDWTFELDNARTNLVARDPHGRTAWTVGVRVDGHVNSVPYGNFVLVRGHLVVANLGTYFVVVDPLHESGKPHILWSHSLRDSDDGNASLHQESGPAGMRMMIVDGSGRPLGTVGAVRKDVVYYQAGSHLYCADLLTGDTLWERRNIDRGSIVRADDDHVVIMEREGEAATILRADDGRNLDIATVPPASERVYAEGRHVLVWKRDPAGQGFLLALRDIVANEEVWSRNLATDSKIALVEGEEIAVHEGKGRFRVLRIADGKPVVDAKVRAESANGITVVRSAERYILLPNTPPKGPVPNVVRVAGIGGFNVPTVHGEVVAFDRHTGETLWTTEIEFQSLPQGQPEALPMLVLASRNFRIQQQPGRIVNANRYELQLLDTRTGKVVFEQNDNRPSFPYTLESKPTEGKIVLSFMQRRIGIGFDEPGDEGDEDDTADDKDATNENAEKPAKPEAESPEPDASE